MSKTPEPVQVRLKDAKTFGFEHSDMYETAKPNLMRMIDKKNSRVWLIYNHFPFRLGYFKLSKEEMTKFLKGKLTLVPNGCCSPGSPQDQCVEGEHEVPLKGGFCWKTVRAALEAAGLSAVTNDPEPSKPRARNVPAQALVDGPANVNKILIHKTSGEWKWQVFVFYGKAMFAKYGICSRSDDFKTKEQAVADCDEVLKTLGLDKLPSTEMDRLQGD
jgi:hypothetical protein